MCICIDILVCISIQLYINHMYIYIYIFNKRWQHDTNLAENSELKFEFK